MLSYRHAFHAGNFADVTKHVVTVAVVAAIQRKDNPCYFHDTHAGAGAYEFVAPEALKNREFDQGIGRILTYSDATSPPPVVARYLMLVQQFNSWVSGNSFSESRNSWVSNNSGSSNLGDNDTVSGTTRDAITRYPGSPALLRAMLRPQDRLLLTELHPTDHTALAARFRGDRQVQVHKQDAYQGLKAFLPPPERRGMVLIDPAYERKDEYARVVRGLQTAYARWRQGVYLIWYPLLAVDQRDRFHQDVRATGIPKILCAELTVAALGRQLHFAGSGMLIVNPPWKLDEELAEALPWLAKQLRQGPCCDHHLDWLVPE